MSWDDPAPRRVWQRDRSFSAQPVAPEERPPVCGGPDYTDADRADFAEDRKAKQTDLRDRLRAKEDRIVRERSASPRRRTDDDDEDDIKTEEPERYAVNLLRQDDQAWARGGDGGTGVLG
jgi:hypothetical protein